MTLEDKIRTALQDRFTPSLLEVINESRLHAGHNPEAAATGQTHFRIRISAEALNGLSRVTAHRAVNAALAFAFDEGCTRWRSRLSGCEAQIRGGSTFDKIYSA